LIENKIRMKAYQTNHGCISVLGIIYPLYNSKELTSSPDTLLAASKFGNAAPIALNSAVIHIAVEKTTNQKMKKASALVVRPTMK
jgi:hypothetical protein